MFVFNLLVGDWKKACFGKEIRWRARGAHKLECTGEPFVVLGTEQYDCMWGPDRHGRKQRLVEVEECEKL